MILQKSLIYGFAEEKKYYYHCWKQLCCFFVEPVYLGVINNIQKNSIYLKKEISCNTVKVFTHTFDQFNASLNTYINF